MSVIKGVTWVFIATILTQFINLITLPYISRQYDESALSSLGIITSVLALFLIFSSFRLEFFIVKKDDETVTRYTQALYLLTICGGIVYSFLLFGYLIYKGLDLPWYSYFLFVPYLIGAFWQNIATFSVTRSGRFHHLAFLKIARASILLLVMYLLNTFQLFGIIWSLVASVILPLCFYFFWYKKELFGIFTGIQEKYQLLKSELAKNYHAAVQAIFNVVNVQFVAFYIIAFESQKIIASYFFMEKILNAPLNLLASSLRQVIYKHFVDNQNNTKKLLKSYFFTQLLLLFASLLMALVVFLLGTELINFILGDGWTEVALLLNAYVFIIVMQIINIPSASLYLTIDKMNVMSHLEKAILPIKILIALYSIMTEMDIYSFIELSSVFVVIYYCVVSSFLYYLLLNRDKKI